MILANLIDLYSLVVLVAVITSWIQLPPHHPVVKFTRMLVEPALAPDDKSDGHDAQWLLNRAMLVGYPLLTLSLVLGMIWSWLTWGHPWPWDPKHVSALLTWLVYTLYWPLHRHAKGRGQTAAWVALIGLGCLLFTLLGVGWLVRWTGLESQHLF